MFGADSRNIVLTLYRDKSPRCVIIYKYHILYGVTFKIVTLPFDQSDHRNLTWSTILFIMIRNCYTAVLGAEVYTLLNKYVLGYIVSVGKGLNPHAENRPWNTKVQTQDIVADLLRWESVLKIFDEHVLNWEHCLKYNNSIDMLEISNASNISKLFLYHISLTKQWLTSYLHN